MAGYFDSMEAVTTSFRSIASGLPDFRTVHVGYRMPDWDSLLRNDGFPLVWVVPGDDTPEATGGVAVNHSKEMTVFVIHIGNGDEPQEDDRLQAHRLIGSVYDAVMADRSLGGIATFTNPGPVEFTFNPRSGYVEHWVSCQFDVNVRRVE